MSRTRNARKLGSTESSTDQFQPQFRQALVIRFVGSDAEKVRREAGRRRVSCSRYAREMIRRAWGS